MNYQMQSDHYAWVLSPAQSSWSLFPTRYPSLRMENISMSIDYRSNGRRFQALNQWRKCQVSDVQQLDSPHGALNQVKVIVGSDERGLHYTLTFALPVDRALFQWRVMVDNLGSDPVTIDRLTLLDLTLPEGALNDPAFYSNGWGSWNFSATYGREDRFRRTRMGPFTSPTRVNAGTPQPRGRGRFSSNMFALLGDRRRRSALLVGFISQLNHFGTLEACLASPQPQLKMWANGDGARLDPGKSMETDWACILAIDVDDPDPLGLYLDAVAQHNSIRPLPVETPSGWCSWYHYFQNIDQQIIRRNLSAVAGMRNDLPLQVFQIDDGFERRVGDWFDFSTGFPQGMEPLAREIKGEGLTPGIWLAPFILDRASQVVKDHPDWILRGRFNQPVNAGFIWDRFTTALDLTQPAALAYTQDVVRSAVEQWGFPYLKLDFLYAAALPGRYHNPTYTRAQVLRQGLEALRAAAGEEAFLLGCGCPLGSALGLVDAMRIGADVAPGWFPKHRFVGPYFRPEPDAPSARNAIQNVLTRLPYHRRWWANDPDCLLLSPQTKLTLAEVHSLATVISLSGGMLLLSDDLPALPPERLRIAQVLLPLIGQPARLLDWFDEITPRRMRLDLDGAVGSWSLLALFNWDDSPQVQTLLLEQYGLDPIRIYHARGFWSGVTAQVRNGKVDLGRIPAHGVALLALRQLLPGEPAYLGSTLHISQGLEVKRWNWDEGHGELRFEMERPGRGKGLIDLHLPRRLKDASLDGRPLIAEQRQPGVYRLAVDFDRLAEVLVKVE